MSTYDLRADVKAVLESTSLTDPGEVADKVAESIPAKSLRSALRVTLRAYVRQVMAESRTLSAPNFRPAPVHPTPVSSGGHTRSGAQSRTAAAGRSPKVRAIRDGWQRQLDARVHVGDSEWKFLGDCTHDNLNALAAEREANADKNRAWARHYRGLAALLTEHGAETVRDLPAEVLMPALGAVA